MNINGKEINNFAKEIKLEDILPKGNSGAERSKASIMEKYFNEIAGEDGVIQGNELEAFLKKLEEASGDDNVLSNKELERFYVERGKTWGEKFVNSTRIPILQEFIHNLINANEKALENEVPTKPLENNKYFDNKGNLTKEVLETENGTVEKQYDKNGNVTKLIERDKDNNIVKDESYDKKGNVTTHEHVNEESNYVFGNVIEKTETRDKDGNLISRGKIYQNGTKQEVFYDENGNKTKEVMTYNDNTSHETIFNEKGQETSVIYRNQKGKIDSKREYFYDANGNKTKEIYDGMDGYVIETYYPSKDGAPKKIVYKNNGEITSIEKHYRKAFDYEHETIKRYDKDNNLLETEVINGNVTTITDNKTGDKTVIQNFENKTTRKAYDKDGNLIRTEIKTRNKNGSSSTVIERDNYKSETKYDKHHHLLSEVVTRDGVTATTQYSYDKNGKLVSALTTDTNGDYKKTIFTENGDYSVRDQSGKLLKTVTHTKDKDGNEVTIYKNEVTQEIMELGKNYDIKKDKNGNVISRVQY